MRIDYSEPKKSFTTPQSANRPRKEPTARFSVILVVTGLATFAAGFGSGWFLSQRAAKKSFQAAMEQTSLESSPQQNAVPVKAVPPQPAAPTPTQPPQPGAVPPNGQPQTMPEPPLSFYKTLPSGQKNNVMGSGINTKEDKGKQPLQAAMPSNVIRQAQQPGNEAAKQGTDKATAERPARQDSNGFTVQVASYTLKSEAEAVRSKLAGKGYNVFVTESNQGDKGTWYRVRVGRRLEQDAAKELSGKIGKGAIVIPDKD
ncbi:SPOR domain-containing protein [Geobacter sp. AOG2]|uniref:SPOR domain-containing protein n=1 Tax=Geobacter sp. AOG2 TaxID=1566347 RepID=UPI001CC48E1A|nr:SPOR domain-containing protein [Geobacter sp. AOG2]GFE61832.1 SPOR domain-containing protein [Geobacter sp. AOG2]